MVEAVVTRADIEASITALRVKPERMPTHWVERREQLAADIDRLVDDWLSCG